ncbi:DUF190 domain-containing protein [Tatumella saanichensis]|uniref:DUF190 domain-containing protein n=1 Tax=Tatumella saanichensis TaxID=480813 RepID=UPI0004A40089|nr:DUF190 domain-containing protein [Tatumella saanichensis]
MQTGYQITFFTQQDRVHKQQSLAQWLLATARQLGLRGATLNGSIGGFGHDGCEHSITMFDDSDQPVQVVVVVTEEQARQLFALLNHEQVSVFYTRTEVSFGLSDHYPG